MIDEKDTTKPGALEELTGNPASSHGSNQAVKKPARASTKKPTKNLKRGNSKKAGTTTSAKAAAGAIANQAKYPRHSITKALRIPNAILEQNAGKECTDKEAASFVNANLNGPMVVEISSAIKYGFLERPTSGHVKVSDLARKILRPQQSNDEVEGRREAVLNAPDFSDVYKHYRGENLPDAQFFDNALVDTFHVPESKLSEFKRIFIDVLNEANLLEEHGDKFRVVDISVDQPSGKGTTDIAKKIGKSVKINAEDSCFVIMPFAAPLGNHYTQIFEPAIEKAGLRPLRADNDIFATGKIMDQVWRGISSAKVLVAELTSRNPNVFYELGIAHAMKKPVVLISSNEGDVPFDVRHIRVIYYDVNDPFWGDKLMRKVTENITSALSNPEEAIFRSSDI